MLKNINWNKELRDQAAHALVGLVVCAILHPAAMPAALILVGCLWAVREHAQHGFKFTAGSARDLVGWLIGAALYLEFVL